MSVNDRQPGGVHYKNKSIQPWDFIAANDIPFLEGNAIKYLCRWREKGGIEDLKKALHYVEKLIELEENKLNLKKTPQVFGNNNSCDNPNGKQ